MRAVEACVGKATIEGGGIDGQIEDKRKNVD
jgi:hypothetical protein